MSTTGRTVYIAGAGIAGLTLALGLAKFGARVVVLERNNAIQEVGAGLQLSPNARRVLNQLGLDRQVAAKSFEPTGMDVYPFRARNPLVTMPLGALARERYGAAYAVMHRADLAETLFKACKRFANIEIVFGIRAFDVVSHARGVSVTADEPGGTSRSARAFAFAGADGVNSHTRVGVLGGAESAYSGYVAWRTTLPIADLANTVALDRTSLLLGPGFHAVCYPLPHRKRINVVLVAKEREGAALGTGPAKNPDLPRAARSGRFGAILAAARDTWGYWPLSTVFQQEWHSGGIGLLGDAAHAMLPFQAQGAAMAIEDAAILAPLLMTEPTAASAFERYAALRRVRIDRVERLSRLNGTAFHLDWPLSIARDAVLRLQGRPDHLKRLDWLYGFDAVPEIKIGTPVRA